MSVTITRTTTWPDYVLMTEYSLERDIDRRVFTMGEHHAERMYVKGIGIPTGCENTKDALGRDEPLYVRYDLAITSFQGRDVLVENTQLRTKVKSMQEELDTLRSIIDNG